MFVTKMESLIECESSIFDNFMTAVSLVSERSMRDSLLYLTTIPTPCYYILLHYFWVSVYNLLMERSHAFYATVQVHVATNDKVEDNSGPARIARHVIKLRSNFFH